MPDQKRARVYLSLGSNLGDRRQNIQRAISRLGELGEVTKTSSLFETEPMEFTEQPWFLNCAVELRTSLSPLALLDALQHIEHDLGRVREVNKGPRLIDVDVLLYGDKVLAIGPLVVPHPAMHVRRFVLAPLAQIADGILHPALNKTIGTLLSELPESAGKVTQT
jgi:2-amino-4-hydroxy-6-hydroxymethyldihydropteridine diphosphokinase